MFYSEVKTKTGTEQIIAHEVDDIEFRDVRFGKQQRKRQIYLYSEQFATLDTETSHIDDVVAWVYQWAMKWDGDYICGRTPSEFISLLERMKEYYSLNDMKKIIVYIHNASYDIQYLKHYLKQYDANMRIFAIDAHTVLIVDVCGFRFLCSYKLSNMNLNKFSETYSERYVKAVGEIDYNQIRYQDELLSPNEWFYMFSDVASQHDAIENYLKINGYKFAFQAPFTSTGFVRTDCRKASEKENGYRKKFKNMQLSLEQYNLCRSAFMGGLTICSFMFSGVTVTDGKFKIKHKDFNSSYPARQMMNYFPVGRPTWYGEIDDADEFQYLLDTYCCIFILNMENVHIKTGVTSPYIPSSKCFYLEDELKINGKIVYAKSLSITITEIDFELIKRQYDADNISIEKMLIMERGQMPDWLKNRIMYYYKNKCELKHSDPKLYQCSKGLLNGIYGMSATAICRDSYELNDDLMLEISHDDYQKQIERFYNSYNSFMPYQFGVYTTAWARKALVEMIECVGYDNFLYCDTDSVFYISNEENEKRLKRMNDRIKRQAKRAGAFIDDNILGVATDEPDIHKFRALHAKCYAMEEYQKDGSTKLNVVVAGIPKRTTKFIDGEKVTITNAEELKRIDNLQDGFIFKHNGGTRSLYIEDEPRIQNINGHMTETASSCIILNIEKEISDTMWTVGKNYELLKINQKGE